MLIEAGPGGLVCSAGGFVIDPWRRADLAIITHAHADHARRGSRRYLAHSDSGSLLRSRLGEDIDLRTVDYGEVLQLGDTRVSLHPAGHVLGSAQVRVEAGGEVWVVTGDYKRDPDPTCAGFEPQPCDVLITEATFALPIYRWPPGDQVAADIFGWWQDNRRDGRPSVLFCYSLGKAQRVLAELARLTDRTAYLHGAVDKVTRLYRDAGVAMLATEPVDTRQRRDYAGDLVIAPPGAGGGTWMRRFRNAATGFCSGWMRVRGNRRRRGYDRGFVLSDHADWPGLLRTIEECRPQRVLTTHGRDETLVRHLSGLGIDAAPLATAYGDDGDGD